MAAQPSLITLVPDGSANAAAGAVRLYWVNGEVRDSKPLFAAHRCYELRPGHTVAFEGRMSFADKPSKSTFNLTLKAQLRAPAERERQRQLVRLCEGASGVLTTALLDGVAAGITAWGEVKQESRLLKNVLDERANDANLTALASVAEAALKASGVDCDSVTLELTPHLTRTAFEIKEPRRPVRISDLGRPVEMELSCAFQRDFTSPAYYTNTVVIEGPDGIASVQQAIISAIVQRLAGTRYQQWTSMDPALKLDGATAAGEMAARYGWKLSPGFFLRSREAEARQQEPENFQFEETYKLPGVNRALRIDHNGTYALVDAGLYERRSDTKEAVKDIAAFVRQQVRQVTERQLQRSSYAEAIELLRDDKALERSVAAELEKLISPYGFSTRSCHVLVRDLPEAPLLAKGGYMVTLFEEHPFALSVPHRKANLGVSARLRLTLPQRLQRWLEPSATTVAPIVAAVAAHTKTIVSAFLNEVDPREHGLSDLTAGPRIAPGTNDVQMHYDATAGEYVPVVFNALRDRLVERIHKGLLETFGIEVSDVQIRRGEEAVSKRAEELKGQRGTVQVRVPVKRLETGDASDVACGFEFHILGMAPQHQEMFASIALNYQNAQEHLDALCATLGRSLPNFVDPFYQEHFRGASKGPLASVIAQTMIAAAQRNYGLNISIETSAMTIDVPVAETTLGLADLRATIARIKQQIADVLTPRPGEQMVDIDGRSIADRLKDLKFMLQMAQEQEREWQAEQMSTPVDARAATLLLPSIETFRGRVQALRLPADTQKRLERGINTLALEFRGAARTEGPSDASADTSTEPDADER